MDHLKFYKMCKKNQFGINLIDMIKYLNIRGEKEFYTRIHSVYVEHVNYIKQ